jgi:transcriptional regulator with XRE-family HTH domain
MPRRSGAADTLPPAATQALRALGERLAIARLRRRQSQRLWAGRLGVSVPTLIRLERGDPGAGVGVLATALWLIGRVQALPDLADPAADRGALEADVRAASERRARRSAAAIQAQQSRGRKVTAQSKAAAKSRAVSSPKAPPARRAR